MDFSPKQKKNPLSKFCALEIKKVSNKRNYRILEIILHTGRKHQIRSILSYFDLPIIGDKKYGSKIKLQDKIYLFAYEINFNKLDYPLNYLNNKKFNIELPINF